MNRARTKPIPDFSFEIDWFEEIDRRYDYDSDWKALCDEWTERVSAKLYLWHPRLADRFQRTSIFELSGGSLMLDAFSEDEQRYVEFHQRRRKLGRMLGQRGKWLSGIAGLLQP
jgi:hypothetical protein